MLAAFTPLAPDEAYYWVWSRALAPGYLDHPPMIALWIRLGTSVLGPAALGVRLLSPLAAALGSVLLADAAERLLPARRAGWIAAGLLNATLLFGAGGITATPDTPLLLFWTMTLWALARLLAGGRAVWWLVAGAAWGLALASKYTAVLLAPAVLLWLVAVPALRPWLRRPWPWLGAAAALAVFAPVLVWNAAHGWASFAKQGGRLGDWNPARAAQFLGELIGGQILLATPLVALLLLAGALLAVRRGWRGDPVWTLLAGAVVIPALVFVQHALGDRVQANWPAVLYPAAAIATAGLSPAWLRLRWPAASLGLVLVAAASLHGVTGGLPVPPALDPSARLRGWDAWATAVAAEAERQGADFVAVEGFGDASEWAWHGPATVPGVAVDARWRLFALPAAALDGTGLLVRPVRIEDQPPTRDWAEATALGTLHRGPAGVAAGEYHLYRVRGWVGQTAPVALPHPS